MRKTILFLAVVVSAFPGLAAAPFLIAPKAASFGFAADGLHYLVGLEVYESADPYVAAQMLATNGTRLGGLIKTGRTGIAPCLAFDGNRYLMTWEDDGLGSLHAGYRAAGQFISPAGKLQGAPFMMSGATIWMDGIRYMAFGGGRYLVTYTRLIKVADGDAWNNRYIGARIVAPDGTMSNAFRVSTGYGDASEAAFDGTNFFVVWCEDANDTEIRGRFVSPEGIPGTEISINASQAKSDGPKAVVFAGTHYLVVWGDELAGSRSWDVFGQRISPSGEKIGGVIPIVTNAGEQIAMSAAYDGINTLVAWVDIQDDANWNVFGRVIDANGGFVGGVRTISAAPGRKMGMAVFADGRYLGLYGTGIVMNDDGLVHVDGSYGVFLKPPETRLLGLSGTLAFGAVPTGETAQAILSVTNTGNRDLTVAGMTYPPGFGGTNWSGVLAGGEGVDVEVTFSPDEPRAYDGVITVDSDKTGGGDTIALSGEGFSAADPGAIAFGEAAYSAAEGTRLDIPVIRRFGSSGSASVTYATVPRTAIAGQDYTFRSNTLSWADGEWGGKIIPIPIKADGLTEAKETFRVLLSNPSGAVIAGTNRVTVTIPANRK